MRKILLVEDDELYGGTLSKALENEKFHVDLAQSSSQALDLCEPGRYDLIISDLHLDGMNGVETLKIAKKISPSSKTILLTANPSEESELSTISLDIDYYLSKDKGLKIILNYIHKLLNFVYVEKNDQLSSAYENIVVNMKQKLVYKNDRLILLAPNEFSLLVLFLENKNKVLSRDVILESIWKEESTEIDERAVDVYIRHLRQKLLLSSISSIRGVGYEWSE